MVKFVFQHFTVSYQTAEANDLFFANDDPAIVSEDNEDNTPKDHVSRRKMEPPSKLSSNLSVTSDEEMDDDIESSCITSRYVGNTPAVACDAQKEDARLYLRLPDKDDQGNPRAVDGQCAICVSDYLPDDKVVWSGLQCQHAFHAACILPWLANGKKHCPTCRQLFVPGTGTRIEDSKQECADEGLRAESEPTPALSSETTDETSDADSQSHSAITSDNNDQHVDVLLPLDLDVECGNASNVAPTNTIG